MKISCSYLPEDPLLTARQAAAELGIGVSTFWRDVHRERLPRPYYVAPRAPRWRRSEVLAVLLSCPRHAGGNGRGGSTASAVPQTE
jgi:predicted DNA-binding transcriptional regulator AlpA